MNDTRAPNAAKKHADLAVPDDLIEIARISGAHGIRGWVKIQPYSADSTALETVKRWWLSAPSRALDKAAPSSGEIQNQRTASKSFVPIDVAWTKVHGSTWLACLRGLYDRDAAEALKAHSIWVSRRDFPVLEEDEFYWVDLVGCEVIQVDPESDSKQMRLGVVESVEENPAHPLLSVIRQEQGTDGRWTSLLNPRQKPVMTLIPFVAAHIKHVDLQQKQIMVDWPADF